MRFLRLALAGLLLLAALSSAPPAAAGSCVDVHVQDPTVAVIVCDLDDNGMPDHTCLIYPGHLPCR